MAVDVYDIVKGLKQAAHNAKDYPGGYGYNAEDGDSDMETDFLKRDKGHKINDSRVMDGFQVRIQGNILILVYQFNATRREAHQNTFEDDIRRRINDMKNYIEEEYGKITDDSISLSAMGEVSIDSEHTSLKRYNITAVQNYEIPGIDEREVVDREQEYSDVDTLIREAKKKAREGNG